MYCSNCGTKIKENAQFCQNCGRATAEVTQSTSATTASSNHAETKSKSIIKCGNCDHVGFGEPARTIGGKILAWLCVLVAPLITIIYFVATHKYRCPKCKSTFLGVKNEDGVFTGQRGGGKGLMIIVWIFLGIAVIGILASIVLASLNTAREKANEAAQQNSLELIR